MVKQMKYRFLLVAALGGSAVFFAVRSETGARLASLLRDFGAIRLSVPGPQGGQYTFTGHVEGRGEAQFTSGDGAAKLTVASLAPLRAGGDETLVTIRPSSGSEARIGTAFVFKRPSGQKNFTLAWSLPRLTLEKAADVDTYLEMNGGSPEQALRALDQPFVVAADGLEAPTGSPADAPGSRAGIALNR